MARPTHGVLASLVLLALPLLGHTAARAAVPSDAASSVRAPAPAALPTIEQRPDVLAGLGLRAADARAMAAASLDVPIGDVEVYLVNTTPPVRRAYGLGSAAGRHVGMIAVPRGVRVGADGTVAPSLRAPRLVDPTFTTNWGNESYLNWTYFDIDDGGWFCRTTRGEIRGQFEYARLPNDSAGSRFDYWGVSARVVAEITRHSSNCEDTISSFTVQVQSRAAGALAVRQDPRTGSDGNCSQRELRVNGSFAGITAGIAQAVPWCERWNVSGAVSASAATWYSVTYDHRGHWHRNQREAALVEIIRVPKGVDPGLNTRLGLDVDNR
jgi:hypothetical protein